MKTNHSFSFFLFLFFLVGFTFACNSNEPKKTKGSVLEYENSKSSNATPSSQNQPQNPKEKEAQATVKTLFNAWESLDLEQYLSVWSPNAVKYIGDKSQTLAQIKAKRTSLFNRLESVSVDYYSIENTEIINNAAKIVLKYSMTFNLKNGKVIKENDITEIYDLVYDDFRERWLIKENRDYVAR